MFSIRVCELCGEEIDAKTFFHCGQVIEGEEIEAVNNDEDRLEFDDFYGDYFDDCHLEVEYE